MRKKLLYLSSNDMGNKSADIVCIMEMCDAFKSRGYEVTLFVPKFRGKSENLFKYYDVEKQFEIKTVFIPKKLLNYHYPGRGFIFSIIAAFSLFNQKDMIIYTRDPWTFFYFSCIFRREIFFESHQIRFKNAIQTVIFQNLIHSAARTKYGKIICISDSLKKQWGRFGVDVEKICVAHDSVNIKKFIKNMSKSEARENIGVNIEEKLVVYTGSLNPGKGVDVLIKSATHLPNVQFLIAGGNDREVANFKGSVTTKNIHFTGMVPPSKVPIFQAAADILALPNTKGSAIDDVTSPMKLFEYMASGRPIVSSDMPSLMEILTDGYNALISPSGDELHFALNIKKLFDEPLLAKTLTENARKDLHQYTWEKRAENIHSFFAASAANSNVKCLL